MNVLDIANKNSFRMPIEWDYLIPIYTYAKLMQN